MKIVAFFGSLLGLIIIAIVCTFFNYKFSMGCSDHLKRAADANTIETAEVELRTALAYMQVNDLTHGHVSIFLKQPKNDIGFWYTNLSQTLAELEIVPDSATQLEKSNVLMKLRETILDETQYGTEVTTPSWVSVHPYNGTIAFLVIILGLICFVSGCMWWADIGGW